MVKKERQSVLIKGGSKILYELPQDDMVVAEFRQDLVYDSKKTVRIKDRPKIAAELQGFIFAYLETFQVPTHFFRQSGEQVFLKKLDMIPVQVTVRNIASRDFSKRFKRVKAKTTLDFPIFEYILRDEHGECFVNDTHLYALRLVTPDEFRTINRLASKINAIMKSFFERRGFTLVDISIMFGRYRGTVMVGDEITPESFTLIDHETAEEVSVASARDSREATKLYQLVGERILPSLLSEE